MKKQEIISKLKAPGQYMGDYLYTLEGLKRSQLIELARDVDAEIRSDYSNLEIKKAIVYVFMLPRHWAAYASFTVDDIPNRF